MYDAARRSTGAGQARDIEGPESSDIRKWGLLRVSYALTRSTNSSSDYSRELTLAATEQQSTIPAKGQPVTEPKPVM